MRRNGFCFVSVVDELGENFVIDFARATTLADALESAQPCAVSDCHARVLELQVIEGEVGVRDIPRHLGLGNEKYQPHGNPRRPQGPWTLSLEQGVQLAREIRAEMA